MDLSMAVYYYISYNNAINPSLILISIHPTTKDRGLSFDIIVNYQYRNYKDYYCYSDTEPIVKPLPDNIATFSDYIQRELKREYDNMVSERNHWLDQERYRNLVKAAEEDDDIDAKFELLFSYGYNASLNLELELPQNPLEMKIF